MKKTVTVFFSLLCVSLFCGIALTGCNLGTSKPEHTHTYASEWSFDDIRWIAKPRNGCASQMVASCKAY